MFYVVMCLLTNNFINPALFTLKIQNTLKKKILNYWDFSNVIDLSDIK